MKLVCYPRCRTMESSLGPPISAPRSQLLLPRCDACGAAALRPRSPRPEAPSQPLRRRGDEASELVPAVFLASGQRYPPRAPGRPLRFGSVVGVGVFGGSNTTGRLRIWALRNPCPSWMPHRQFLLFSRTCVHGVSKVPRRIGHEVLEVESRYNSSPSFMGWSMMV